ncbi:MAG: hypothetical protein HC847_24845, partial [Hydrococcus sp. RU_2_2]|nr:hypothetical protein [Hydrococcus sp. RU_2_2]
QHIRSHCTNNGFSAGELSGFLLQLELLELISQLPGMRYQRIG